MMVTPTNPKARAGVDRAGRTALHYAAADADVEATRRLLKSGMEVSAPDDNGWTPLHFAAQASAADVARVLLDAGARIDARDSEGNTPLFRAVFASRGHGDVIELLRARGADPTIRNNHGISPVDLSRTIANYNVRQFFADLPGHSDG